MKRFVDKPKKGHIRCIPKPFVYILVIIFSLMETLKFGKNNENSF